MPAPHESDSRRLHEVEDADEGSPHDAEDGRDAVGEKVSTAASEVDIRCLLRLLCALQNALGSFDWIGATKEKK